MKLQKRKRNVFEVKKNVNWQKYLLPLLALSLVFGANSVSAEEKSADDWKFDATVYLWGSTINQTTGTGDDITINFGTILKNLDFAAMGTFGARKNKFSMLTDVIYLDIGDSQRHHGEFLGQPVTGKLEVGLTSWVLNFVGAYNVFDNGTDIFDIGAGARYVDVKLDTSFKIEDQKRKNSVSGDVWDGVFVVKGRHNYSDGHYLNYYADIGGGGSKLTWQAVANISYDFKKFTGVFGYRYLKWNFGKDTPAVDDMTIHGPYLGAKWSW